MQQLVTCRLLEGSHLVLVRATPDQSVTVGQAVHLEIAPSGWRLFEGEGVALPRPKRPVKKPLELPQIQTWAGVANGSPLWTNRDPSPCSGIKPAGRIRWLASRKRQRMPTANRSRSKCGSARSPGRRARCFN